MKRSSRRGAWRTQTSARVVDLATIVKDLATLVETNRLCPWDRGFVGDIVKRFPEGQEVRGISAPTVTVLENIHREKFPDKWRATN